jgi:surface protein
MASIPCPNNVKILEIRQWGDSFRLSNVGRHFTECSNLRFTATDSLNISNITRLDGTFNGCRSMTTFTGIESWNTTNITNMRFTFRNATNFSSAIGGWNTSNVIDMGFMFAYSNFNRPIGNWNVSNVVDMTYMFYYSPFFNQSLTNWNVTNVTNMNSMFWGATAFNQNISNWNPINVLNIAGFMREKNSTNYSSSNYDALLNSWSTKNLRTNLYIDFGTIKYTSTGLVGRNRLTGSTGSGGYGWTIVDGGQA